jgi:hypothetical protein
MNALMRTLVSAFRLIFFILLVLLWLANTPSHQISDFIGAHFPWPDTRSLKWSALLAEGLLTQLCVAIPTAFVLVLAFRHGSVRVAVVLGTIFVIRAFIDLPGASRLPHGTIFIAYLAFCHILLLTGLTRALEWNFNRRFERSRDSALLR